MRVTTLPRELALMSVFGIAALMTHTSQAEAGAYVQTNLVSDIPGLAAVTDSSLLNPWGVSESASSPFWISDQGGSQSTLYSVNAAGSVAKIGLTVTIPSAGSGPQGPTGQVNNPTTGFVVGGTNTSPAAFIFASLNGTISAWNGGAGTTAVIEATVAGASFTGLAIDRTTQQIYAANDKQGTINVFDSAFHPVSLAAGAFVVPGLPAGLVPFNVQEINGNIYVTYAPSGHAAQTTATAGSGLVAVFSTSGTFIDTLISGSNLASPWGITLAPASFGLFGGDLLVGNFSYVDSGINAFDPTTGALEGTIPVNVGSNTAGGLWDLTFGNGGSGGSANTLYFTDGINGEADGLFASISVPEPSSLLVLAPALALLAGRRRSVTGPRSVTGLDKADNGRA